MARVGTTWMHSAIRLDQPLVLALAPALGYLIAYLDRLGEAVALGVPVDYISISTTDALSRVSVVFLALIALVAVARVEANLARQLPTWLREPLSTLMTWSLNAAIVFLLFWLPRLAALVFAAGLSWTVLHSAWSYLRRSSSSAGASSKRQDDRVVVLGGGDSEGDAPLQARAGLVLILVTAGLIFAFAGGNARAATRDTHLVSSDGKQVVLAIYGERAALGSLQADGMTVGPHRRLVSLSEVDYELEWRRTGPLATAPSFVLIPLAPLLSGGD